VEWYHGKAGLVYSGPNGGVCEVYQLNSYSFHIYFLASVLPPESVTRVPALPVLSRRSAAPGVASPALPCAYTAFSGVRCFTELHPRVLENDECWMTESSSSSTNCVAWR
jgi:hypothetical protein